MEWEKEGKVMLLMESKFGEKIKQLRKKKGWTQAQVADEIGVTKSVISFYENKDRSPSPEVLIKFAELFQVSTDYLLGIEEVQDNTIDVTGLSKDEIESLQNIVDALRKKK